MSLRQAQPVVLVLASGRGERFLASGGAVHKLAALLDGKPVLEHTLDAVRASGLPWHLERAAHPGMGDSIAAAVRATRETAQGAGWLILPGDLPLVRPGTLRLLAAELARHDVVVPVFQGRRGHPVGFSARCADALCTLSGDAGARSVVERFGPAVLLEVDDVGCVTDVDTVAALDEAQALLHARKADWAGPVGSCFKSDTEGFIVKQTVIPQLRISSASVSLPFYVRGLGFSIDWQHQFEPGFPLFLQITRAGQTIFITEHAGDCEVGGAVYFVVPDVDECHRAFKANGIESMEPPVDTPWGSREMLVTDPDGNRLRFATAINS